MPNHFFRPFWSGFAAGKSTGAHGAARLQPRRMFTEGSPVIHSTLEEAIFASRSRHGRRLFKGAFRIPDSSVQIKISLPAECSLTLAPLTSEDRRAPVLRPMLNLKGCVLAHRQGPGQGQHTRVGQRRQRASAEVAASEVAEANHPFIESDERRQPRARGAARECAVHPAGRASAARARVDAREPPSPAPPTRLGLG